MTPHRQIQHKPAISGKKIIIAGGGIAGLSLGLSLRQQWPPSSTEAPPSVTIYERDTQETSIGREGYSLSIRGDASSGGMQVLQKLGLAEKMLPLSLSETGGGAFNLWDTNWQSLLAIRAPSGNGEVPGMRIARAVLRRVMVEAFCESGSVFWDKPCSRVEEMGDGRVRVHLVDGSTDDCDILVVADGASSKIRAQLRPEDTLDFTGVVCIAGTARFEDGQVPKPVDTDWGGVLGGGGTGLFVSPVDQNRALWSVSYYSPKQRERLRYPLSEDQVQSILQEAIERGQHFREPFQSLVQATDPATIMVFKAMDKQPFAHKGVTQLKNSSIIFIGDANHAVSPFAGNGANMALLDGWELAEQLIRDETMTTAVENFDDRSIPRSTATLNQSHWAISTLHASGLKLLAYRLMLKLVGLYMSWGK